MQELKHLLRNYKKSPDFDPAGGGVVDGFSLENGEWQLKDFFQEITLKRYENSLEITDADAIVD